MAIELSTGNGLFEGVIDQQVPARLAAMIKNAYKNEFTLPFEITAEAAAEKLAGYKFPVKTDRSFVKSDKIIVCYEEDLGLIFKFKKTKEGTKVTVHNEYGNTSADENLEKTNQAAQKTLENATNATINAGKVLGKGIAGVGAGAGNILKGVANDDSSAITAGAKGALGALGGIAKSAGNSAAASGKKAIAKTKENIKAAKEAYDKAKETGNAKDIAIAVTRVEAVGGFQAIPLVGGIIGMVKKSGAKKAWREYEANRLPAIAEEIIAELKK